MWFDTGELSSWEQQQSHGDVMDFNVVSSSPLLLENDDFVVARVSLGGAVVAVVQQ
jgi:hypothetical protein